MNPAEPPSFTIRAARKDDALAITALRNMPGVRHGTLAVPFGQTAASIAYLEKLGPDNHLLVAEAGTELVGTASLNRHTGRRAHVAGLGISIADPWQGKGAGTALMSALIDLADNWLGLVRIELNVFTDNRRAIALYEKFGFMIEGRQRAYALRDGVLIDSLSMARIHPAPSP
ncbi:GNAT family N-acetyltransferase [Acidiphilium sp. PA]|uniref:GNAT family N-acetyltransferase n=1 Tax=Acidiphilium sp. PA TaxID=2871705 RepID=UPI002244581B|nr:GNAT family N-acetyltransferase [Acidiphilium sp. PA]MCW8305405.1 GNAT family N-acetyltransferase [Acidiphilium sp. PA]